MVEKIIVESKKKNSKKEEIHSLGDFTEFGAYSLFIIILYECMILPQMGNMTFMMYGGLEPKVTKCGNYSLKHLAKSIDACKEMKNLQNSTNCIPNFESQFGSIAEEFGYHCEEIIEIKKSISTQMFGVFCGAIFGQFSDLFGRKRMLLVAHVGMFLLDYAASYADSLFNFTFIQFFTMFFVGGHNTIMHVFLLENIAKNHRVWVLTALSYSPNFIIFAGIAYLSQEWRMLLTILSLLNIPAFIGLLLAFESPRWLIQKARLDEARIVLTKIESINGTSSEERLKLLDDLIEKEALANESRKKNRKYYIYHLFYTKKMCLYGAIISFGLLVTSVLNYSLLYNIEHLSGSIYLNSALFGLVRYALNLLVGILDYFIPKVGRRLIYNIALEFILVTISIVFLSKIFELDNANLLRIAILSAAAMCSQMYMVNAVITSELFPTAIRNLATSFVQCFNRVGSILGPHLFYLAMLWSPLPFLIMIIILIVNLILFNCYIPETKTAIMQDHLPNKTERIFYPFSFKKKFSRQRFILDEEMPESSSIKLTQTC